MQDRFTAPRPTFSPTTNVNALQAMTPGHKDDDPSLSVVERLAQDNSPLAALIAQAQEQAKANAKVIEARKKPRQARQSKVTHITVTAPTTPLPFQPSDVLDDATFIRRTRDVSVHTPEMQVLFWANGGAAHMVAGLTYAQAYHNLRQQKMFRLRNTK